MTEIMYWIWISRMKNLDFECFDQLMRKYGSLSKLWQLSKEELITNTFCNVSILSDFLCKEYRQNLQNHIVYINKHNIKVINCYDNQYPVKLKYIENRPIVLYALGNLKGINNESVAIVGSRWSTKYGSKNANFFAEELARRGVNVISGLAKGIDAAAHSSCINVGGKTIAVVGHRIGYNLSTGKY